MIKNFPLAAHNVAVVVDLEINNKVNDLDGVYDNDGGDNDGVGVMMMMMMLLLMIMMMVMMMIMMRIKLTTKKTVMSTIILFRSMGVHVLMGFSGFKPLEVNLLLL